MNVTIAVSLLLLLFPPRVNATRLVLIETRGDTVMFKILSQCGSYEIARRTDSTFYQLDCAGHPTIFVPSLDSLPPSKQGR